MIHRKGEKVPQAEAMSASSSASSQQAEHKEQDARAASSTFETSCSDMATIRVRMFNVENKDNLDKKDDASFNGFEIFTLADIQCLPKFYVDHKDLFQQFYETINATNIIDNYIKEIEAFLSPGGKTNLGCILITEDGTFGKSHPEFEEFEGDFTSSQVMETANGFKARDNIEEGEILLKEETSIICKFPSCVCSKFYYFECSYCTRSGNSFFVCHDCNVAIYCSDKCRTIAFEEYHQFECRAAKCHFFGKNNSLWVAFRMLMIGTLYKFNTESSNKYQYICKVSDRKRDVNMLSVLRGTTCAMLYLRKYTNYFTSATLNELYPTLSVEERFLEIGAIFIKHALQAYNGTFFFPDETISLNAHTGGKDFSTPALCVRASKILHACNPNCAMVMKNNNYSIKALRDIMAGETISLNFVSLDEIFYGPTNKFQCKCNKCYSMSSGTLILRRLHVCYKCKGKELRKWQSDDSTIWVCRNCKLREEHYLMDLKVKNLHLCFKRFKRASQTEYKQSLHVYKQFMALHKEVYAQPYPEFLYVVHNMFQLAIMNCDIPQAEECANIICVEMPSYLNKYSFLKLDIFTSIVNAILANLFKRGVRVEKFLEIGKTAVELLKPMCKFYSMDKQYKEFSQVFHNAVLNFRHRKNPLDFDNVEIIVIDDKSATK